MRKMEFKNANCFFKGKSSGENYLKAVHNETTHSGIRKELDLSWF